MILDGAMENHYRMLKSMNGVPGVLEERLQEARRIRHCALSLVGEPIMYPHINEFVDMLHERKISSFLVTNAQFPEKVKRWTSVCTCACVCVLITVLITLTRGPVSCGRSWN